MAARTALRSGATQAEKPLLDAFAGKRPATSMTREIFPGDSEMAQLMRAMDWSATTLGPVEHWPASLRTSVSTCLECAFPIVLWWGPELAILYNDEYRHMLGPKHPAALGQRGAAVWAEIWDIIAPMLSQVFDRAEATRSRDLLLHIDRGYLEEAYFSFSYSPIYAEHGRVGGVFCPVIETTEKVIGERRLRTLRDLAARCKGAESEASAYADAAAILGENPHDIPFALIYRVDQGGSTARLHAWAGIAPGTDASPDTVPLGHDAADRWSLGAVARSGRTAVMTALSSRFDALPTGAWKIAPHTALVLPVLLPGQDQPRAILVAAASPMRALDADYRTFFGLIATQIAAALADAQAIEEERRRAQALAEIDRAKTAFFSNVSHEFRTPLTLMLGPIETLLAETGGPLTGAQRHSVEILRRNAGRLLKLVNALLDFSRLEAGRAQASYQLTDVSALTCDLAGAFRSAIEHAGVRFEVACDAVADPVFLDRDMWEKIVLNLLSNALKFTFEGVIRVELQPQDGAVELTVRDTGTGIPEAELPRIFERFHRVEGTRSRTHEGTGIGLALTHELVRLHGGTIAAESRLGEGTRFVVRIPTGSAHLPQDRIGRASALASTAIGAAPFVDEAARWFTDTELPAGVVPLAERDGDVASPRPSAAGRANGRERILVADDNADMRDYLRQLLRAWDVTTVPDGTAALEQARRNPPDLIVSDVMMPGLDGFALLDELRRDPRTAAVPVLMLSARAGEEARVSGLDAGADDYVVKPFSARELTARVGSLLNLSRARRDALLQKQHAEAANRTKDQFLAMLGHELRNPLAPILTALQLMKVRGGDAMLKERTVIDRQVRHLARLVDDLLDVSRIARGKIELRHQSVDLAAVVSSAIEGVSPILDERRHHLDVDVPRGLVVRGDPTRLAQVVINVLTNAAKYTEARGRIRVAASADGDQIELRIADNGIGISADMLGRIFDMFMQERQALDRAHGGLGLGLTIVKSLVESHGGSIRARSDGVGRGSEFIIRLPSAAHPRAGVHDAPEADTFVHAPSTGQRILVVDDNVDAAHLMADALAVVGHDTRVAFDGPAALDAAAEFRPHAALLDLGLPLMDGYELAEQLAAGGLDQRPVLVAVTGYGQPEDEARTRAAGFAAHVVKPVDVPRLIALLDRLLAGEPAP